MVYMNPNYNRNTAKARLREMIREGAQNVMEDLNCHGKGKDRMLREWIDEEELMDIGTAEYTHRWGAHRYTIDRILTRGGASPWAIEEEWGHTSDHAILGVRLQRTETRKRNGEYIGVPYKNTLKRKGIKRRLSTRSGKRTGCWLD